LERCVTNPGTAAWTVVAASVQGAEHETRDTECQDAHAWRLLDNGWLVAAVADGAGSAKHSAIGARTAVDQAVLLVAETLAGNSSVNAQDEPFWRAALETILRGSRRAVLDRAAENGVPAREMACTLILVVLGPNFLATAHVGDGAVVVLHENGWLETVSEPERTEYINETTFLTSSEWDQRLRFTVREKVGCAVAAFTDGLQLQVLRYADWSPAAEFFTPTFKLFADLQLGAEAETMLRRLLRRLRQRAKDDLTLLVATRTLATPVDEQAQLAVVG
jgi:hypothetical protein